MYVYDREGKEQILGELLAKGGEGEIYPLADPKRSHIVVKCYLDHILQKNGSKLKPKIEAMCAIRSKFKEHDKQLCWPAISVFDKNNKWKGYAMRKAEGRTMLSLAHAVAYKKYSPNLSRKDIVNMMIKLLKLIKLLHKNNIMIGDYNLNNFMWDPKTYEVMLIDCDSYQVTINGMVYPCLVGSPDLTAPEQHVKDAEFEDIIRTKESEYFSIAIILFKCLMLGRHPYDTLGGDDPVKNLRQGKFPYGLGNNGIPKGYWGKIWSHFSYNLKSLFIRTFTEGHNNPSRRATIDEWISALNIYTKEIDKCYHENRLIPTSYKEKNKVSIHKK